MPIFRWLFLLFFNIYDGYGFANIKIWYIKYHFTLFLKQIKSHNHLKNSKSFNP